MQEPAYVSIAAEFAQRIRANELTPGAQLPSYAEIAQRYSVSDIVVRKAVELLLSQGLVRSVRRRGVFVADRPSLIRVSPERQFEEVGNFFRGESDQTIEVESESTQIEADEVIARLLDVAPGAQVAHIVTKASDAGRPISISDTYQPLGVTGISTAVALEESLSDRLPVAAHASWLNVASGDLVKAVRQRFFDADGSIIMVSDISFPRDRYDAFVFRMDLNPGSNNAPTS